MVAAARLGAQEPNAIPSRVAPGAPSFLTAPSDAKVMFSGASLEGWTKPDGSATGCRAERGEMVCRTGAKDAVWATPHRSAQIHVEFKVPVMPNQKGQLKGNSGVFLMGCYELQILDGIDNPTYSDGMLGALYKYAPPLVNAARAAGEWQSYDIFFNAPKCDAQGKATEAARATVLLNGVLVQNHSVMDTQKHACHRKTQNLCAPGAFYLQDHSGFPFAPQTELRFRNIWMRDLP